MKRKKVWRYYCDFCGKGGCSKPHMARHEKHCTKNPDRVCGMCDFLGLAQRPLGEILAEIPAPPTKDELHGGCVSFNEPEVHIAPFRDATEGCPACILAAIRQSEWADSPVIQFNYNAEAKEVMNEHRYYNEQMINERDAETAAGLRDWERRHGDS